MLEMINQKNMNFLFLIASRPRNISELAKLGDLTLSFASTLISRLARENVICKTKADGERGREIIITLTEYGAKQVKLLRELKKNYNKNKEDLKSTINNIITEKGGKNGTERT
jgi:DNA-binding MarR family transcriptional regulator